MRPRRSRPARPGCLAGEESCRGVRRLAAGGRQRAQPRHDRGPRDGGPVRRAAGRAPVILLVSVSARMLAELATREGYDVCAVDRFGDLDLQRLCPSVSLMRDHGGHGGMEEMVEVAEPIRADSVVYGAGLENRPDLVDRLAAGRTLLGCSPETLRRVRDPAVLGASLRAAGFAYPRTLSAEEAPERADRGAPLAAQAGPRRRRPRGARVARRPAARRRDRAGAHRRAPVLRGGGRRRALRGPARRERAADRAPRARRPRLAVVRERRAAAAAGAASRTRWRRPRRRSAPTWPARSACAACSGWTWSGTGSGRGWWRSTRARSRRSRRSTPRTASARSRPIWRGARDACRRPRAARPGRPARRCCSRPRTCGCRTRASGPRAGSATCPTPARRSQPGARSARSSRRGLTRRPCWPSWRRAPPRCAPSSHEVGVGA